jgi:hypothetical protein
MFCLPKVEYSGFKVIQEGVQTRADHLKAISPPKDILKSNNFWVCATFFRAHIPNFAQLTAPLTDLTKQECPYTLITDTCQRRQSSLEDMELFWSKSDLMNNLKSLKCIRVQKVLDQVNKGILRNKCCKDIVNLPCWSCSFWSCSFENFEKHS